MIEICAFLKVARLDPFWFFALWALIIMVHSFFDRRFIRDIGYDRTGIFSRKRYGIIGIINAFMVGYFIFSAFGPPRICEGYWKPEQTQQN